MAIGSPANKYPAGAPRAPQRTGPNKKFPESFLAPGARLGSSLPLQVNGPAPTRPRKWDGQKSRLRHRGKAKHHQGPPPNFHCCGSICKKLQVPPTPQKKCPGPPKSRYTSPGGKREVLNPKEAGASNAAGGRRREGGRPRRRRCGRCRAPSRNLSPTGCGAGLRSSVCGAATLARVPWRRFACAASQARSVAFPEAQARHQTQLCMRPTRGSRHSQG